MFKILSWFLDLLAPIRSDFEIVNRINEENILDIPRADKSKSGANTYSWIVSLFKYKDKRVKAMIWELKYRGNFDNKWIDILGNLLYEEIFSTISDLFMFDNDAQFLLIPIPISEARRRERGYNQSEYLARAIVRADHSRTLLYAPQWFSKIKETDRQSRSQSREDRIRNLVGCFEANPNVANKYVILVDDVTTTGTTLNEARHTLLSAGARDVYAFTVAH
jgi:ComF family protein